MKPDPERQPRSFRGYGAKISRQQLKTRRVNLDTGRDNVAVISRRSKALRPEVFRGFNLDVSGPIKPLLVGALN